MDRKGIITVILCAAVLVLWQIDNAKRTAVATAEKRRAEEAAKVEAANAPTPAAPAPAAPLAPNGAPILPEAAVEEKLEQVTTPAVDYTLTNLGGGIQRAILKKHQAESG